MACDPMALTIDQSVAPLTRPSSMAASVSAVSPDWLMESTTDLRIDDWIAVTKFRPDLNFTGNTGNLLDQDLAHHARIGRRSTGGDDDPVNSSGEIGS